MLRRALATIAVSSVAVVGLAPAASAQIVPGIGNIIKQLPCNELEQGLKAANLIDEDTTRNQLASKLRTETGKVIDNPLFNVAASAYAGQLADRALECEIVKEDPKSPIAGSTQFLEMFESLSSVAAKQ